MESWREVMRMRSRDGSKCAQQHNRRPASALTVECSGLVRLAAVGRAHARLAHVAVGAPVASSVVVLSCGKKRW